MKQLRGRRPAGRAVRMMAVPLPPWLADAVRADARRRGVRVGEALREAVIRGMHRKLSETKAKIN